MDKVVFSTLPIYSLTLVKEKDLRYPVSKIGNAVQAAECLSAYLEDKDCEHLVVLLMDGQNNFLGMSTITIGTINGMTCAIRDVFKAAIVGRASAIILGHSHPSGDCTPSRQDVAFTNAVIAASKIMSIPVVDHIIISAGTNKDAFSFSQSGLM